MKYSKHLMPYWDNIKEVQDHIELLLADEAKDLRNSISMATEELLENAFKYHLRNELNKKIKFEFKMQPNIYIGVKNIILKEDSCSYFEDLMGKLNSPEDAEALYFERLTEILNSRVKGESRLGLVRIVYEGGFSLKYIRSKLTLKVIAEKEIEKGEVMKPLEYNELRIDIGTREDDTLITWSGRSRDMDPENVLDPYLKSLIPWAIGRNIIVDLTKLTNINSSTIPPIMSFMAGLEEAGVNTRIVYNDLESWQRSIFAPLALVVRQKKYKYVSVKQSTLLKEPL